MYAFIWIHPNHHIYLLFKLWGFWGFLMLKNNSGCLWHPKHNNRKCVTWYICHLLFITQSLSPSKDSLGQSCTILLNQSLTTCTIHHQKWLTSGSLHKQCINVQVPFDISNTKSYSQEPFYSVVCFGSILNMFIILFQILIIHDFDYLKKAIKLIFDQRLINCLLFWIRICFWRTTVDVTL